MFKVFSADLNKLPEMLAFVREQFTKFEFGEDGIQKVELACEEAIVNTISHGYLQADGNITIECLFLNSQGIKIIISDEGVPFNPMLNEKTGQNPLESDKVGGLGIHLILNLMDKVTYVRENNRNKLTLIKYKKAPTIPS
jgi:serine/threonine-protein kinase RsbW